MPPRKSASELWSSFQTSVAIYILAHHSIEILRATQGSYCWTARKCDQRYQVTFCAVCYVTIRASELETELQRELASGHESVTRREAERAAPCGPPQSKIGPSQCHESPLSWSLAA